MKYKNAKAVLPQELVEILQEYYQQGYLYIPKRANQESALKPKTNYEIELEKRNQHIFSKYLEGWSYLKLASIYHLSESSIRRIILKQKRKEKDMVKKLREIISLWGMECEQFIQRYPSVWEVNNLYMIKVYNDKTQLERNKFTEMFILEIFCFQKVNFRGTLILI